MFRAFDFCIPTRATAVPAGDDWLHEVKYDGYRLRLERDGDRVRLITRGGYNWTDRYPWIVESALKNRHRQLMIDGEAVVLGVGGVADFAASRSRLRFVRVHGARQRLMGVFCGGRAPLGYRRLAAEARPRVAQGGDTDGVRT
jgi:ATP-dependent DNA ligase